MREFCEFDKACNYKLKKLAIITTKHANLLYQDALTIWFQNVLKPTHLKSQNS